MTTTTSTTSPTPSQLSSGDFWQKRPMNGGNYSQQNTTSSTNGITRNGVGGGGSNNNSPPINDASLQYYWSRKMNPFYDYKVGSTVTNGSVITHHHPSPSAQRRAATLGTNGHGFVPSVAPIGGGGGSTTASPSSMRRNPFPLTLPLYQNNNNNSLPRARLNRDEEHYAPRASPLTTAVYGTRSMNVAPQASNGVGNGNTTVGYKLAGAGQPSPHHNHHRRTFDTSPMAKKNGSNGTASVWTVEADHRLATEEQERRARGNGYAIPQGQQQHRYGDKSLRLTPPPSTPRRGGSGKQQRWGRFMQTLCCCIAPPPPPSGVARDLNGRDGLYPEGKQISRSAPGTGSGSPISQIKNGGGSMSAGTTILSSSNASQQNGNSVSNAATANNSPVNGRANATSSPPSPSAGNPLASIIAQTDRNGVQNGGEKNGNGAAGNNTVSTYETSEGGLQITVNGGGTNGIYKQAEKLLLPPLRASDVNRKCLIIDLDETLVHSSFKPVKNPDFVIPVEIDGVVHQVYVLKRPYVDEFLARVGEKFECVLFTASLAKYADPVADLLDKRGVFRARLFREACVFHKGNYIKDLARLGRDLSRTIIVDNSPTSYLFHPENAIPVPTWFDDPSDVELLDILPLLDRLAAADSVYSLLRPRGDSSSPSDGAALLDRSYS